mmetsp:Transcript_5142/g.23700  ORF Transcript_5142/g.23700 Transcript_5142/m.23700 type:complete len:229 (-) Transcript_5142:3511-4197(-)
MFSSSAHMGLLGTARGSLGAKCDTASASGGASFSAPSSLHLTARAVASRSSLAASPSLSSVGGLEWLGPPCPASVACTPPARLAASRAFTGGVQSTPALSSMSASAPLASPPPTRADASPSRGTSDRSSRSASLRCLASSAASLAAVSASVSPLSRASFARRARAVACLSRRASYPCAASLAKTSFSTGMRGTSSGLPRSPRLATEPMPPSVLDAPGAVTALSTFAGF